MIAVIKFYIHQMTKKVVRGGIYIKSAGYFFAYFTIQIMQIHRLTKLLIRNCLLAFFFAFFFAPPRVEGESGREGRGADDGEWLVSSRAPSRAPDTRLLRSSIRTSP